MNKFVVSSLIGSSFAALVPSPLPGDTAYSWPKYASAYTFATGDKTTGGAINKSFTEQLTVNIGPLRGFRNGLIAVPTQKVVKAPSAGNPSVAAQTTTRTFYQFTQAQLGDSFPPYDATSSTTIANTIANSAGYVVCEDATTAAKCNGGAGILSTTNKAIPNKVAIKAGTTTIATVGGNFPTFAWNSDIVLASFFHATYSSTTAPTDGKTWCSAFKTEVSKTVTQLTAVYGFSGKTKCTWQLTTKDGTTAPGFKLTSAEYFKFAIQYVEWITLAGLGSDTVLPATNAADYHLGAYTATEGVYINPQEKTGLTGWSSAQLKLAFNDKNPKLRPGGSLGDCAYYTSQPGLFEKTGLVQVDTHVIISRVDSKKRDYEKYENEKKDYDTKVDKYDKEVTKENERKADALKATFDAPVKISSKPNMPSQPQEYDGPVLNLQAALTIGTTAAVEFSDANKDKIGKDAYLVNPIAATADKYKPTPGFYTRMGYLLTTLDNTKIEKYNYVGHVFGKLGQAANTDPQFNKGFYWGKPESTLTPGMMISIFPAADADTGLASGKKIEIGAYMTAWDDLNAYAPPPRPPKAKEPMTSPYASFAKYISAGVAASMVVASLY